MDTFIQLEHCDSVICILSSVCFKQIHLKHITAQVLYLQTQMKAFSSCILNLQGID